MDGKLSENNQDPGNEINWHNILEHARNDHKDNPEEQLYQVITEDEIILIDEIIFSRIDVKNQIGKVI